MDTLVSRALMIRLSLHPSPAFETSAFNNIRAFSSRCAGLFPFRNSASSCSRSSALNRTTYLFTEISFTAMIASVAIVATKANHLIEAVEKGASRREAAEHFDVSVSSAIKWLQRWHESKSAAPKPRGGSVSPLEEFAAQILARVAEQPDLTLVEIVAKLRKQRIRTSRRSLW